MKTRIALAAYYLAIACLVVFAGIMAMKLIFWPPCTQMGHDCVVDGWSVAGLAGTVLAVAATILAILGAVAVAVWWTSLNDRVTEQVTKLYEGQKRVVSTIVDRFLQEQEQKVDKQLSDFQKRFTDLEVGLKYIKSMSEQIARNNEEQRTILADMKTAYREAIKTTTELNEHIRSMADINSEILTNNRVINAQFGKVIEANQEINELYGKLANAVSAAPKQDTPPEAAQIVEPPTPTTSEN